MVVRVIQLALVLTVIVAGLGLAEMWREKNTGGVEGEKTGDTPAAGVQVPSTDTTDGEAEPTELTNTKIVCFGDSFTLGYPGPKEDAWPAVLQTLLKVEVVNKGATAQPSYKLLERFDSDVLPEQPGRVIILAGNGDALDNNNEGRPLADYQRDMTALINKAEASHIKPILVLPLPYPGETATRLIGEYRAWLKTFAEEKKIMLLDFKGTLCGDGEQLLEKYAAPENKSYPGKEGHAAVAAYAASVL
jgi:lysophospholipase L1-like esterase